MIVHHPSTELLLNYVSGSLPATAALVVASHVSLCGICTDTVRRFESVAGALLDTVEPVEPSAALLSATLARLDEDYGEDDVETVTATRGLVGDARLPPPVRRHVRGSLDSLPWRRMGGYFEEVRLPVGPSVQKVALVRLKPGALMPRHAHGGHEYTVVLSGGFSDGGVQYGVGDFSEKDIHDMHQPVIDPDDECLCLVAMDAPVKLTGLLGKIINPFLRV